MNERKEIIILNNSNNLTIVGLGTVGSSFLLYLINNDFLSKTNLIICDYDGIEDHNPIYNTLPTVYLDQYKNSKVDFMYNYIKNIKPNLNITPIKDKYENLNKYHTDSDFIIDCRDTYDVEDKNIKIKINLDMNASTIRVNPNITNNIKKNNKYSGPPDLKTLDLINEKTFNILNNFNTNTNEITYHIINNQIIKKSNKLLNNTNIYDDINNLLNNNINIYIIDLDDKKIKINNINDFNNIIKNNKNKLPSNVDLEIVALNNEDTKTYLFDIRLIIASA